MSASAAEPTPIPTACVVLTPACFSFDVDVDVDVDVVAPGVLAVDVGAGIINVAVLNTPDVAIDKSSVCKCTVSIRSVTPTKVVGCLSGVMAYCCPCIITLQPLYRTEIS